MVSDSGEFKSGFVAVMGRPNVGKSTLINALIGQKVAAVSPRPQTTRRRQEGILTSPGYQVIFIDTPGVHQPHNKLGESMNQEARHALEHCDLALFILDASQLPTDEDHLLSNMLHSYTHPNKVLLVLNKIDLVHAEDLPDIQAAYQQLIPKAYLVSISATRGDHRDELLQKIIDYLPAGEAFYPEEQVTDLYERDLAADLVREACLDNLRYEVPHGIMVRIDEYTERDEHAVYIEATIFVERESHKGIVIGMHGQMLKRIGMAARKEIEAMNGKKVFLLLRVKVRKNWRDDERLVKQILNS